MSCCVECSDPTHNHPADYNRPVWVERREEMRVTNARIGAIVHMQRAVALHEASLLMHPKQDDPVQKQAISGLMEKLCEAEVNLELREVFACLKELFP